MTRTLYRLHNSHGLEFGHTRDPEEAQAVSKAGYKVTAETRGEA